MSFLSRNLHQKPIKGKGRKGKKSAKHKSEKVERIETNERRKWIWKMRYQQRNH